jgi:glycosyltransferase involved in cell wall biosynthesis
MKILIVASGNHANIAPFVKEQMEALQKAGHTVFPFTVNGHGPLGYLSNLWPLKVTIRKFEPDIIHAHYGLCGLFSTLQHQVPVVVTYHGSDINSRCIRPLSRLAMRRAAFNIFVSETLQKLALHSSNQTIKQSNNQTVLPCGVDLDRFAPIPREDARKKLGLLPEGHYVLFSGAFDNEIKNAPLAQASCALLPDTTLLELRNRSREEVALLMNAADVLLVTSRHEGSPQVVKEALACNLPVVSTDVGDIATLLSSTQGGSIAEATPQALATAMEPFLDAPHRTQAREKMGPYSNTHIASQLCTIYNQTITHNRS